jgi:hypothetical protein
MPRKTLLSALLAIAGFLTGHAAAESSASAQSPLPAASAEDRTLAREIFKELIEINTTDTPAGNVTTATTAMQKRFLDAGFPAEDVHLLGPTRANRISWCDCEPGRPPPKSLSCFSATWTLFRLCVPTGPPILFNSWRRTAISTAAARRT